MAVVEFDLDGSIRSANQIFLNLFGYTRHELIGSHHSMLVDPRDRQTADYLALWASLRRGEVRSTTVKRLGKNGRPVWLQATYSPILGRHGRPRTILKIAADITAQSLHNSDDYGQIAALNRSQAVIEFSSDGSILAANSNFLRIFGYSREEIVGRHHRIFVPAHIRDSAGYAAFWARLTQANHETGEYERIGKDGNRLFIQGTYNPIVDGDGTLIKIVKFATDVTEAATERRNQASVQQRIVDDLGIIADAVTRVRDRSSDAAQASMSIQADIGTVAEGAVRLSEAARDIDRLVAGTLRTVESAREQATHTTSIMSILTTRTASIGDVVALIQAVASQTNLLALNATIEAARAGEAGRGFAIVAQEVKQLAATSAGAARQIESQIAETQDATGGAMRAIQLIVETIESLTDGVHDIAGKVRQQADVSRRISDTMSTAERGVNGIHDSIGSIAKAIDEVDQSARMLSVYGR